MSHFQGHVANVIPGTHTAAGGTTNFHFGYPPRQDRSSRKRDPFSTVPFAPDADFVDRPEILAWVRDKCARPGARVALVGLGGVGKSQLAIQYAHQVRDAAPQTFVFWVHASTKARFEEAYRGLADRLALPGRHGPKVDVLRLVSDWLCDERNGRWTMIVDNADDVEPFFPSRQHGHDEPLGGSSASPAAYLPQSRNGCILITSRNKDAAARLAGGFQNIQEVPAMDESQGLQLLRNKLRDTSTEEGAVELLRALDYMPLAISQAAAYINRRARMTTLGYLDEFRANDKKRESLLNLDAGDLRRDESASNAVVTTWQVSFERIRQERPSAADLLSLMSFFNPQGIPESVLRRYSSTATSVDSRDEADSTLDEDLDTLHAYSLVTVAAKTDVCEMHALVQSCTQVWLSSFGDAERWRREFVALMAREFPTGQFENWGRCQQLLPHVEPLYGIELASDELLKEWAQVLTNAAWYLWTGGSYKTAQAIATRALAAREGVLGPEDERTLTTITVLALVLQDQGKYAAAEAMNRRALEGERRRWAAEEMNRRALEGREKALGKEHPDTLTSGKYEAAEEMNRRALEGYEKELGKDHPWTLTSVNNLALVLRYQGKYEAAEEMNRRALEGREKVLGKKHPDTLTSVYCLAYLLYGQRRYGDARELYQRACNGLGQALGSQHPTTIACLKNFSAMQQEAQQAQLRQSRESAQNDEAFISDFTSPKDMSGSANSRPKNKQGSIYARVKRAIRRKNL